MRIFVLFLLLSASIFAKDNETRETSAAFLRMGVGARALSMGGAFSALSDDLSAIYWNTAGLSDISGNFGFMFNRWPGGINHTFFGATKPLEKGGVGIGLLWADYGEFEIRDENGILLPNTFNPYDLAVITGIGYPIAGSLLAGLGLTLIQEKIYEDVTRTGLVNIDLLYKRKGISFGLCFKNLGGGLKGFSLPREARLGFAYREEGFILSSDVVVPEDSKGKITFGTEYGYDPICLRIGYERLFGRENLTSTGFRLGFGVKIRPLCLIPFLRTQIS
ncbi:MAG: PorV/PorQ family protein [bacterium]